MRAVALFLALLFLIYTFASDYQQKQASRERYQAIAQYTEESRAALEAAKHQNAVFETSLKNTSALLVFMDEMTKSMREVSEILRSQQREHQVMLNGKPQAKKPYRVKKKRKPRLPTCYDFVPRKKRIGSNEVTVHEAVPTPCE
jgi:glutamate/tyrosine decarboxylase-like PLP-dependent enzyme